MSIEKTKSDGATNDDAGTEADAGPSKIATSEDAPSRLHVPPAADPLRASSKEKPSKSKRVAKPRSSSVPTPLDTFAATGSAWGYPAFARDFPRHPELDALIAAFTSGDYRAVRKGAPKLASTTDNAAVKRAAETLRARIEPDASSRLLFLFAGLLLAFLTVWWVTHDGPEDANRQNQRHGLGAEPRDKAAPPSASSSTH